LKDEVGLDGPPADDNESHEACFWRRIRHVLGKMKEAAEAEGAIEIFAGKMLSWLTKLNIDKVFRPLVPFGCFPPLQDYQNGFTISIPLSSPQRHVVCTCRLS
jgi:hypothetical protein